MRRHAVWIVLLILGTLFLTVAGAASAPRDTVYFDDSGPYLLVGNGAYEIALQKRDGGLISIVDKSTGQTVSNGSLNRCLWVVVFPEEVPQPVVESCEFYPGGADAFHYGWSPETRQLTLTYTPDSAGSNRVPVTVTLTASEENWFDLQLALTNHKGAVPKEVKFPSDLVFDRYGIGEALLPVLPGVILNDGFFSRGMRFEENYPGTHFADFVALRQGAADLAMYAVAGSDPVAPVFFGFTFDSCADAGSVCLTHNFNSGVASGDAWTSPRYRFRLNEDFPAAIASFRHDNGIDAFDPVETKLGALYDQVVRLPTYKMDLGSGYGPGHGIPFSELAGLLDTLPYPGILHLVAYWPRGFDENYPDFLPPDPDLGTQQELVDAMENARARGHLVMPYINPTWWDHDSPTVQNLPPPLTLEDIVVLDREGNVVDEWYGSHHGFFASPHVPFVQERLEQLLEDMSQAIPSDLIHEDQVGGLWSIPDFNPAAPDSASYARAWLAHTRQYRDLLLTTEKGYDRLAETVTGFHGSILLEEADGSTGSWWGAGNWRPYPLAPLLLRDKVLLYHHTELRGSADSKEVLSLSLALGYMLSYDVTAPDALPEWRLPVGAFQSHVISRYAAQPMTSYETVAPDVTQTQFVDAEVVANWSTANDYEIGPYTLPPSGALVTAAGGSLIAGIFTRYNGVDLTPRDHYLIEERAPALITIRQPLGPDTPLTISLPSGWESAAAVYGFGLDGEIVGMTPATTTGSGVSFQYRAELNGHPVAGYRILPVHPLYLPFLVR